MAVNTSVATISFFLQETIKLVYREDTYEFLFILYTKQKELLLATLTAMLTMSVNRALELNFMVESEKKQD